MQDSFPVDRYPGPVCRYAIEDGTPVVCVVNSSFESRFGAVESGAAIAETLDDHGIVVEDIERRLTDGDRFTVDLPGMAEDDTVESYLVETVPPTDGANGFLVFTASDPDTNGEKTSDSLGVDHVASVVSHDLRNPLDVAKAHLRAARELKEEEHFERVAQAHERMERIIQDVLTLTRGTEVVEPDSELDFGSVAETAWETVETDGASLVVDGPLPTAPADPDRVSRLFENLFRNAVQHGSRRRSSGGAPDDHSKTGGNAETDRQHSGVSVTVGRVETGTTDGFYVADDGPGIPPEEREKVLQPGYSSDDHGTGLGLAIVQKIAEAHDWTLTIGASDAGGARIECRELSNSDQVE